MLSRLTGAGMLFGAVSLLLLSLGTVESTKAEGPGVYVVNSLARVTIDAPPPAERVSEISLSAAANEFEGVQVILFGGDAGITGADAELAAPLVSVGGYALPPESVRFYRAHYIAVTEPSGDFEGGAPGVYPDALIPFVNPYDGRRLGTPGFPASPFAVRPNENQPVYIEVHVPAGTPAGLYRSAVRILHDGGRVLADLPVTLRVWDFELPRQTSLRTLVQTYDAEHWLGPAKYYGYEYGSPEHRSVAAAADEALLEHRLTPATPFGTQLRISRTGAVREGPVSTSRLPGLLERPEVTSYVLSFYESYPYKDPAGADRDRTVRYLSSAYDYFAKQGLAGKLLLMPGDEPQSSEQYAQVRELARVAHEANPDYEVLMTIELTSQRARDYLFGEINTLVAGYWDFDPEIAAQRIAAGDKIWTYTAVVQNQRQPSPYWEIDHPPLNYRVAPWINYHYSASGLLYWATTYWNRAREAGESAWSRACTYRAGGSCYNGEGLLLYPGREIGLVVPAGAHGEESPAAVYGVAPSLRLKALRDGIEDYEYLRLASGPDAEAAALEGACRGDAESNCFHNWETDPGVLLATRERLALLIESLRLPGSGEAE